MVPSHARTQNAEAQKLSPDTHHVTLTTTAITDPEAHQGQLMRQGDENDSHSRECLLTYPCAHTPSWHVLQLK